MSAILSTDVTYTIDRSRGEGFDHGYQTKVNIAFGNGALTYPAGGIPLTMGKMGPFRQSILSLLMSDASSADGYLYKWDSVNNKIRIYQAAGLSAAGSHTHDLFLKDGDVADGTTTRVNAGDDLLGANTGGDLTVHGVANTSGHGGILPATITTSAGSFSEVPTSFAPAATTLYCTATGV